MDSPKAAVIFKRFLLIAFDRICPFSKSARHGRHPREHQHSYPRIGSGVPIKRRGLSFGKEKTLMDIALVRRFLFGTCVGWCAAYVAHLRANPLQLLIVAAAGFVILLAPIEGAENENNS